MTEVNKRIYRLFKLTGLDGESFPSRHSVLSNVDRMHFRHALLDASSKNLQEPFRSMRAGLPLFAAASATESQLLAMEQQVSALVDRLVIEVDSAAARGGGSHPYRNLDWLWRQVAFATMVYAGMETTSPVMMNLMLLKVARVIDGPGGFRRLEQFILSHGYEYAPGEDRPK
jgi:hypothetical protein